MLCACSHSTIAWLVRYDWIMGDIEHIDMKKLRHGGMPHVEVTGSESNASVKCCCLLQ